MYGNVADASDDLLVQYDGHSEEQLVQNTFKDMVGDRTSPLGNI